MKKGLIILAFILITGNVLGQLTGNYKSAEYTLFDRGMLFLKGIDSYIGGMDLTLESDSNFLLKTCSVIETGKWSIVNDSLYLDVFTRKSRIDSLNNTENKVEWLRKPFRARTYEIIENGFYQEIYLRDERKGKIKSADKLIRNNLP